MDITMNIILDSVRHFRYESHVELPTDKAFRRAVLLPRELNSAGADCLYVCRLSDALRIKNQHPELYCLCLRDRIQDERETEALLKGCIVINENLELERLLTEVQETFLLINDWYQNMLDAIIKQKSMQDIISMSEPVIGNFISVSDSALTLLAYTKNIPTDDPTSVFLIEHGYHSEETIKLFKKNKRYDVWMNTEGLIISADGAISKYTVVSKVFAFNETYFTHVVMTTTHRELTPGLLDLFNHLIHVLSFYIKRNWEEKKDYDHVYSALVVDLLQGKITDSDAVNERARIVGIRPNDQYVVMLLTGAGSGDAIFPGLLSHDITRMFPRIRPVFFNCRLMLFMHHSDLAQFMQEQNVEEQLNDYFQKNSISCGVSDIFDDLLELTEAFAQAETALLESSNTRVNARIFCEETRQFSNIARFNTFFARCFLDKDEKMMRLWRRSKYGRMLIELFHSDQEKNTNNLQVLYSYLMNERRATETASYLHMHRNNVIYRITRIEELLNISLEDMETRLNLMISFLMFKCSGVVQEYQRYGFNQNVREPAKGDL